MKPNLEQGSTPPRAQLLAERAFATLEKFLHIEAFSGVVLLIAAAAALIWANSSYADGYHHFWHTSVSFSIGSWTISETLHFLINDGLMTVFFLVVGMEIRREIHEGALANMRLAALPLSAAVGGVVVPALIYFGLNPGGEQAHGWAVPTATDIAFAVGVLALLGRSIPSNVRVFLLALAIIDDIVAVLIIAVFYSGGLDYSGFIIAAAGIIMVLGMQRIGIASAYAYVLPGAVLWFGFLKTGAHPTLAGVVLGLMTPVFATRSLIHPLEIASKAVKDLWSSVENSKPDPHDLVQPLKQLRQAQRDLLPPVSRVQMTLHPYVAFGIMPIFALANAGVSLNGIDLSANGSMVVMIGVLVALVAGKPLGIIGASLLVVRLGWCALPPGVTWSGVCLVGMLAGIGFTMSIFIATLAFTDPNLLGAAKLGILLASLSAAVLGLAWGFIQAKRKAA
ncbi:MAG: Na+/H+ antiporter NhaA [Pseudomonadota bacterium]